VTEGYSGKDPIGLLPRISWVFLLRLFLYGLRISAMHSHPSGSGLPGNCWYCARRPDRGIYVFWYGVYRLGGGEESRNAACGKGTREAGAEEEDAALMLDDE
jgi:hypothetical protein